MLFSRNCSLSTLWNSLGICNHCTDCCSILTNIAGLSVLWSVARMCSAPLNTGLLPCVTMFKQLVDLMYGRALEQTHSRASLGSSRLTDLVFAYDTVILADSVEVLILAIEALHETFRTSSLQVKIYWGLLVESAWSVHAWDKNIEILEAFLYLRSTVQNKNGSSYGVLRLIGLPHTWYG